MPVMSRLAGTSTAGSMDIFLRPGDGDKDVFTALPELPLPVYMQAAIYWCNFVARKQPLGSRRDPPGVKFAKGVVQRMGGVIIIYCPF